ncbi:MAG: substrate-binding domain-containing protein [Miltoncostaeaceae bacterium]
MGQPVSRAALIAVAAAVGVVALPAAAPAAPASRGIGAEMPARAFQAWCSASSLCTYSIADARGPAALRSTRISWIGADERFPRAQVRSAGGPVAYYPMMLSGIAVAVNVPGIKGHNIDLRGTTIAEIFSGVIRNWNDRRIRQTNLRHHMPRNLPITLCVPRRPSGESWDFSRYLSRTSAAFRRSVGGASLTPRWKAARIIRTPRVTATGACMAANSGAITFLPVADATREGLAHDVVAVGKRERVTLGRGDAATTVVRNVFTHPTETAIQKAGAGARKTAGTTIDADLLNSTTPGAYPITAAGYAVVRRDRSMDQGTRQALSYFLGTQAQGMLPGLGYAPLPASLLSRAKAQLAAVE